MQRWHFRGLHRYPEGYGRFHWYLLLQPQQGHLGRRRYGVETRAVVGRWRTGERN